MHVCMYLSLSLSLYVYICIYIYIYIYICIYPQIETLRTKVVHVGLGAVGK